MKLGDLIETPPPITFDQEPVLVLIDKAADDGLSGEGDLTYHGIKLGRVKLTQTDTDIKVEVL